MTENMKKMAVVRDYHEGTKHQPNRYAKSLGYMDWETQPNPFRTFEGVESISLSYPELRNSPAYDALFVEDMDPKALDVDFISRLFAHSLALSAWKQGPNTKPWSLRANPSSGALHPTEGYLISGLIPGLIEEPGVFHYGPFGNNLERRCKFSTDQWKTLTQGLPSPCLFVGLTSIYWRESWKYGERAYRYCHLDVGHAIGAITFAARSLGWEARVDDAVAHEVLSRLLGTHLQKGMEAEHADCLMILCPSGSFDKEAALGLAPDEWQRRSPEFGFSGKPNRLSPGHHKWEAIEDVCRAAQNEPVHPFEKGRGTKAPGEAFIPPRSHPAEQIIRQRRSAVAMDRETTLGRSVFYEILRRTLPDSFPFDPLQRRPYVSLAIFVHRVKDMKRGLYLLIRDQSHEASLRKSLGTDFIWKKPEGCPGILPLYLLAEEDKRVEAKMISCHQEIAGDGVFSLGMLAQFDEALNTEGPRVYPRLYWECGLIGQVLYLEAEAGGVRGTGIGCYFDDVMHKVLGITNHSWQSLYHFTIGVPVEDPRLQTLPAYFHLGPERRTTEEPK